MRPPGWRQSIDVRAEAPRRMGLVLGLALALAQSLMLLAAPAMADEFAPAATVLSQMPDGERRVTILAHLHQEGHWTLRNAAGEVMTAATPEELARAVATVAPSATRLLLTAETLGRLAKAPLPALARLDHMAVAVNGAVRPLARLDPAGPLHIVYRPRMLVTVPSASAVATADAVLGRKLAAPPRALRIMPGGPSSLAPAPAIESRGQSPSSASVAHEQRLRVDAIDPQHLMTALRHVPRQTLLLTGRIDQSTLVTSSGGGRPEARLDLAPLGSASRDWDISLLVLATPSPLQPETRSWLIQPTEISGWRSYLQKGDRRSFADLIEAVMDPPESPRRPLVVAIQPASDGTYLEVHVAPWVLTGREALPATLTRAIADWGRTLLGRPPTIELRAVLPAEHRLRELDRRLIGWLPWSLHWGLVVAYGLGLLGLPLSWRWWQRLWPKEAAGEYGSLRGLWLAEATRRLVYGLLFMPLVGGVAGPMALARRVRGAR